MKKIAEEPMSPRAVSRPPSKRQQEDLIDPGIQSLKPPSRSSLSSSSSSPHASATKLTEDESISQGTKTAKRHTATYENSVGISQNDTPELFPDDNGDTFSNRKVIASSTASMSVEDSKLKAATKTPGAVTSYKKDPATMKVGASHAEAASSDLDAKIKAKIASNETATKPGAVAVVGGDNEAASSGLDAKIKAKVASNDAATIPGAVAVVGGDNSDDLTMKKSSGKETLLSSKKPQMYDESNGSQLYSSDQLVDKAPLNDIGFIHIHDDEAEETKEDYERNIGAFSIPGIGGPSRNVDIEEGSQTDSVPPESGNEDRDEILVKASIVEDSEIFQAEAVSEDRIRRRRRIICCLILIVVVINVIVLSVVLPKDPEEATLFPTVSPTPIPTATPSASPSSAPTTSIQGLLEALSPASIPALSDESSPQFRALEWIESNATYYADFSPLDILDSFALATLYYSAGGEGWFESRNWLERKNLCSWHGVGCNHGNGKSYVDEIILTRNRLRGKLPLEVSVISGLVRLDFSDNILTGDIPNELGSLNNLESLILEQNNIVGTIPKSLGELRRLSQLSLSSNSLEGSIPDTLANIPRLASLALDENNLSGEIPPSIGKLVELRSLKLMENRFETLPSEIGLMRKLDLLDVSENNIVGSIPSEIGLLRRIRMINLQSNVLSGNVPSTIGTLSTLTYLDISTNLFKGNITTELFSLPRLDFLDLSSNAFSGTVPIEVALAAKLETLNLDNNDLVGSLPSEIGLMGENLATFSIFGNSLNGSIPSEVGDLNNLVEMNLGGRFSGSLPSEFGLMRDLERLNIAGSVSFTGSIPSDLSLLSNLEIISLSDCGITGRIPALGKMSNLMEIDLSYNDLTGTIPDDIDALTNLLQLDLRENLIDGSIPRELWSLSTLQRLHLNDMALTGSISQDIGMMTDIEILDLGTNEIDQTLPTEIGKLTNLQYLDVQFNKFIGTIPTEVGMFVDISFLSFGLNPFMSGQLPSELGHLTLVEEFSVQANFLGGTIPSELGLMTSLTTLNLGGGFNTGGTIPTELGQLINLSFQFNLSVNRLTGTIPSELGLLSQVTLFSVFNNELTGTIPTELGTLSDTFSFTLGNNFLTGTIPSEVGKLSELISIRIDETNLSGLIPEEICLLEAERLSTLDFDCGEVFCECCNRKCPTPSPSASPMPSSSPTNFPTFRPSVSPMPSSTPTGSPTLVECEPGFSNVRLDLKTDDFNSETTTFLIDSASGENIATGGPYVESSTRTVEEWCVPDGICAIFTIYDTFGDGICCGSGQGSYTIYLNKEEVGTGGEFGSSDSWRFGDCVPTSMPSGAPTGSPTTSAMPSMSPAPTSTPWVQLGNDLDGEFAEWSGFSVSISEDGNTIAIGSPNLFQDGYVTVMGYNANADSWEQIGPNIDDNAGDTFFGQSVSLCKDASTVAVGANFDDENGERSGSTRVFRYQADMDEWIQIGQTFYGQEELAQAGVTVALNKDGTRLVFPVFQGDGNNTGLMDSGYVQIYDFNVTGNIWTQVGQQIDGEGAGDAAGRAASISDDGSVVAIGAHRHDGNAIDSGHVRVFQYNTNTSLWVQLGESINGGMAFGDRFGVATSLSSDGMTVASGSTLYDGEPAIGDKVGGVLIHQYDSLEDAWTQIGQTIQGGTPGDYFGQSVSLSGDGNTVAVGAPGYADVGAAEDSKRPGYGQVFRYNSIDNEWIAYSQVFHGELMDDNFGQAVGLSNDGKTVAFGAPNNNYLGNGVDGLFAGSVEIFRKPQ